jgi:hypothetical protein
MDQLSLGTHLGLEVVSCGLFISSGRGEHPDRILDNYELIVVKKGTLSLWEEDVRFDVPPGHALLLFPDGGTLGSAVRTRAVVLLDPFRAQRSPRS